MAEKPKVNKTGDSRRDLPKGGTPNGEKPRVNRYGNTQEPNRENTRTNESPDVHHTGD